MRLSRMADASLVDGVVWDPVVKPEKSSDSITVWHVATGMLKTDNSNPITKHSVFFIADIFTRRAGLLAHLKLRIKCVFCPLFRIKNYLYW